MFLNHVNTVTKIDFRITSGFGAGGCETCFISLSFVGIFLCTRNGDMDVGEIIISFFLMDHELPHNG